MRAVLLNIKTRAFGKITRYSGSAEWVGCLFAVAVILHSGGIQRADTVPYVPRVLKPAMVEISTPPPQPPKPVIEPKKEPVLKIPPQKAEHRFHPIILKAASRYDVDPALVKAIIKAESGYNARALSKRGAMGLMQLMPGTAEELGVKDGFNPEHNINGGVRYFKKLMDRFEGDVSLALAAYNAGSTKVRRYRGVPPFKATRYYVKKVFEYYEFYKDQMAREVNNA